jgi:hypothetical protein
MSRRPDCRRRPIRCGACGEPVWVVERPALVLGLAAARSMQSDRLDRDGRDHWATCRGGLRIVGISTR